jgi:hypothetical protein
MGGLTAVLGRRPAATPGPVHRRHPRSWIRWWPAPAGCVVGAVVFVATYRAMPDDALITLAFARNLVDHGCWCITDGLEVNTATSPAAVWLDALAYAVLGHAFWAAGVVFVACHGALGWLLHHLAGPGALVAGLLLLATSPVLTASVGMETILGVVVLLAVTAAAWSGRWASTAVLVATAPVIRPDLAVGAVAAVAVCAAARRESRRPLLAVGAGAVLVSPWYVFSWWHFGSPWPDTLPVKAFQPGWGDGSVHLWNSLPLFLQTLPTASWLTVALLVAAVGAAGVAVARRQWPAVAVLVGGVGEFAALSTSATTPIIYYPGILVGAASCAVALVAAAHRWTLAVPALLVAGSVGYLSHHADALASGYHPLRQNWATNAQYARIVDGIPTDAATYSPGEVGALAFYCEDHGCRIVDPFLADPGRVGRAVDRWRDAHPALEPAYAHRRPAPPPVPTRYLLVFTYPARPQQPGDVATLGGLWTPGYARVVVGPPRDGVRHPS